MLIKVKQKHIDAAENLSRWRKEYWENLPSWPTDNLNEFYHDLANSCPISLALAEVGFDCPTVRWNVVYLNNLWYSALPQKANNFIEKFDAGLKVKPFSFELPDPPAPPPSLEDMQGMRKQLASAFAASPAELGKAAVEAAKKVPWPNGKITIK